MRIVQLLLLCVIANCWAANEAFIFVYRLPREWHEDILAYSTNEQWLRWYRGDEIFYNYLMNTSYVTTDPATAKLFFIPFFTGRQFHELGKQPQNFHHQRAVSESVGKGLAWVQQHHPYWNASGAGRNHFAVFPMDHGRCDSAGLLSPEQFGHLISVSPGGDIFKTNHFMPVVRSVAPELTPWYCYHQPRDVVFAHPLEMDVDNSVTSPFATTRNWTVLYRFSGKQGSWEPKHHEVTYGVRAELARLHALDPIPGSDFRVAKSPSQAVIDMRHAIFCVLPPGWGQYTGRLIRAVLAGCIPVIVYRGNDPPFVRHLRWSEFAVHIEPDELTVLKPTLLGLLSDKQRILEMQQALGSIQTSFSWQDGLNNAPETLVRELEYIARNM